MKPKESIYQEIISARIAKTDSRYPLQQAMISAYVFFIDNVAEYYYLASDQDEWDLEHDFINMAPPFDDMWFEWSVPSIINANGKFIDQTPVSGRMAMAIQVSKKDDVWRYIGVLFVKNNLTNNQVNTFPFGTILKVDKDGEYIKDSHCVFGDSEDKLLENYTHLSRAGLDPVLLAISFIHCRNVKIVPKGAGVKSERRDRDKPRFRYHLLEIEPMKKVIDGVAQENHTGIKMAMHICRGHFKDYRRGKGLFGKYKEVYWWDNYVRGDAELGFVDKDYIVSNTLSVSDS